MRQGQMMLKRRITVQASACGFTMIELLVSMSMGLIILLGTMMMFTSDAKVASALASRTERLGDLYIASQIMQNELRNAQAGTISWASNKLNYTDQDGQAGYFEYQYQAPDRLYWKRPNYTNRQEMIRDLDTSSGLAVSSSGTTIKTWKVTLKSAFKNESRATKTMQITFNVWARN